MTDKRKRGRGKYKNFNILRMKHSFLVKYQAFIIFQVLSFGEYIKIAGTSFNFSFCKIIYLRGPGHQT